MQPFCTGAKIGSRVTIRPTRFFFFGYNILVQIHTECSKLDITAIITEIAKSKNKNVRMKVFCFIYHLIGTRIL